MANLKLESSFKPAPPSEPAPSEPPGKRSGVSCWAVGCGVPMLLIAVWYLSCLNARGQVEAQVAEMYRADARGQTTAFADATVAEDMRKMREKYGKAERFEIRVVLADLGAGTFPVEVLCKRRTGWYAEFILSWGDKAWSFSARGPYKSYETAKALEVLGWPGRDSVTLDP